MLEKEHLSVKMLVDKSRIAVLDQLSSTKFLNSSKIVRYLQSIDNKGGFSEGHTRVILITFSIKMALTRLQLSRAEESSKK